MTIATPVMSLGDLNQRIPTSSRWENLEEMYKECLQMFSTLVVYPQEARNLEPIANEEEKLHLQRILKNIRTDCESYRTQLEEIRKNHLDTNGAIKTGIIYDSITADDLFVFTSVGAEYRSWAEAFEAITMQPASDFGKISEQILARQAVKA